MDAKHVDYEIWMFMETSDRLDYRGAVTEVSHRETFFAGGKRAEIPRCRGSSANSYDNYIQDPLQSLRYSSTNDADVFTNVDRSPSYHLIEELREQNAATALRHPSRK